MFEVLPGGWGAYPGPWAGVEYELQEYGPSKSRQF